MDNQNGNGNINGKQIDKLIKMGEAEKILKKVMTPIPTRPTLISFVKKGVLKGKRIGNNFYIFESSLQAFIRENQTI